MRLYFCHLREWLRVKTQSYWTRAALYGLGVVATYYVLDKLLPPTPTPIMSWPSLLAMVPLVAWWSARGFVQLAAAHWFITAYAAMMALAGLLYDNDDILTRSLTPGVVAGVAWLVRLAYWWIKPRGIVLHLGDGTFPLTAKGEFCPGCKRFHWALFAAREAIVLQGEHGGFAVELNRTSERSVTMLALGELADGRAFCPPVSLVRGLHAREWRPAYHYIPLT